MYLLSFQHMYVGIGFLKEYIIAYLDMVLLKRIQCFITSRCFAVIYSAMGIWA